MVHSFRFFERDYRDAKVEEVLASVIFLAGRKSQKKFRFSEENSDGYSFFVLDGKTL